jgi:predicted ATPase with chaperone activity
MLTQVFASAVFGIEAQPIFIEVHIDKGIGYHLVGLPDNAVKKSNYRIPAALHISGYKLPGKTLYFLTKQEIQVLSSSKNKNFRVYCLTTGKLC